MAPLFLVLAEKSEEGKTPLFFKSSFSSVRVSIVGEIHPALHPTEIKGCQGQVEWDFEQSGLVEIVSNHDRGLEVDDV